MTTAFVYPYLKEQTVLSRGAIHFQFNELEISIQSVKKFFKGEPVFWVIGDNPKIKGINFINSPRINCISGREFDVYHKLQIVLDTPDIPDDFVWMYDDHIFLDKFNLEFIQQVVAYDYIYDLGEYLKNGKVGPGYKKRFKATIEKLQRHNLPTWDYETHLPRYYNKSKLRYIFKKYRLHINLYLLATLYFNRFYKAPDTSVKKSPNIKGEVYNNLKGELLTSQINGKKILNYWDMGVTKEFRDLILKKLR